MYNPNTPKLQECNFQFTLKFKVFLAYFYLNYCLLIDDTFICKVYVFKFISSLTFLNFLSLLKSRGKKVQLFFKKFYFIHLNKKKKTLAPTFEGLSLIRDPSDYGLSGLGLRLVLYAIGERERERERERYKTQQHICNFWNQSIKHEN